MSQMGADLEQLARLRTALVQQSEVIERLASTIRAQLVSPSCSCSGSTTASRA